MPITRDVVITSIGIQHTTENGNTYLECETTDGRKVAIWGSECRKDNIETVLEQPVPFEATILCLSDRQDPQLYWVPESSRIVLKMAH